MRRTLTGRIAASVFGIVQGIQILFYHHGDFKNDGVIKFPQIQPGELLDLLQAVDQRVAVHIQLARGLGDVEVILKKLVDRLKRILIERLDRVLLEDLVEEHLAQRGRELIDDAAQAEVLIIDDRLLCLNFMIFLLIVF